MRLRHKEVFIFLVILNKKIYKTILKEELKLQCKEKSIKKNTIVGDLLTPIKSLKTSYSNLIKESNNYFYKQVIIKLAA